MKKQPFLYFLIALIVGILFAEFSTFQISWFVFFGIIFISSLISFLLLKKNESWSTGFLLIIFLVIGFKLARLENNIPPNHYLKVFETKNTVQIKLEEKLKPSPKYNKYFAKLEYSFDTTNQPKKIEGKILVYLPKENAKFFIDDELVVASSYYHLEFSEEYKNYTTYLNRKGVYGKLFAKEILNHQKSNSLTTKLEQWKEKTSKSLQTNGYNQKVISLIQSLLFGDRNEIDQKTMVSFQNLGVIHILSISGLHTTIVYAIFYFFFNALFFAFGGRKLAILFALVFVVAFTFFVGLKPPVLRTTLMLLLYFGSFFLQRKSNIYHALYLSAFMLLVYNPNFLFDIGFQLSYLAVFFIVWLHPLFKISITKNKIVNYFLNIVSVSFSAQIGTLPLILYYFNNFSLLFLIGNLLFIPFTFVFIVFSIFSLFTTAFNLKIQYFTLFLNEFTNFVLNIGIKIGDLNQFVFSNILFNKIEVTLSYLICLCLPFLFNKNYNFKIIYSFIVLLILIKIF